LDDGATELEAALVGYPLDEEAALLLLLLEPPMALMAKGNENWKMVGSLSSESLMP